MLPSKPATFYLQKFTQFPLYCVLRPPERCVTLNRDPVYVAELRWDANRVDTSVALAIMRERKPDISLCDGAEDHFKAFLEAHNVNVYKVQALLDESPGVSKCPTLDKSVYKKLVQSDVLTTAALTFAATVATTYRDAMDECCERACYGELYFPSAEVWEKPFLVTTAGGQDVTSTDFTSTSTSVVPSSRFAEYSWKLQNGTANNRDNVDHTKAEQILIGALARTTVKVNTTNSLVDVAELRVNWTSHSAQLRCSRYNTTVTHSIALPYGLAQDHGTDQGAVSEMVFVLSPVATQGNEAATVKVSTCRSVQS